MHKHFANVIYSFKLFYKYYYLGRFVIVCYKDVAPKVLKYKTIYGIAKKTHGEIIRHCRLK